MPFKEPEWIEPEVFLEHKGIAIYHTYHKDKLKNKSRWEFSVRKDNHGKEKAGTFTFWDLTTWKGERWNTSASVNEIKSCVKEAINSGELDGYGRKLNPSEAKEHVYSVLALLRKDEIPEKVWWPLALFLFVIASFFLIMWEFL